MSNNIPYPPNLAGKTDAEKIALLHSYLWQLAEQLNWALATLEAGTALSAKDALKEE